MMTNEDVARAAEDARQRVLTRFGPTDPIERGHPTEHVLYMLARVDEFMAAGRREKAMRWLGFVQGWLWASGMSSIDDLKNANRPEAG
jgi:hypothetical protein